MKSADLLKRFCVLFCLSFIVLANIKAQINPWNKKILNENPGDTAYRISIKKDKKIAAVSFNEIRKTPESILFKEDDTYKASQCEDVLQKFLPVKKNIDRLQKGSSLQPQKGITVLRYQQYFKGIKVEHGSYTVTSKDDRISYISGEFYVLDGAKSVIPVITDSQALKNALTDINAEKYMWQQDGAEKLKVGKYPKPELVIMEDYYGIEGMVLAYKFDIYAIKPLSRNEIYVSAVTGKIIYRNALIHNANSTGTADTKYSGTKTITTDSHSGSYRLRETRGAASGVETYNLKQGTNYATATDFTDADNNWTNAEFNNTAQDIAALDAHWGAETVYDYWKNIHNRKSWDGNDALITSYVHYDVAYDNAFFDGNEMNYGDGGYPAAGGFKVLTSLDVCGHEIGHGVCATTCNLTYARESGAMNEGFSDIWASCIEHFADPTASTYDYWLIGEEITPTYIRGVNRDALRDMKNPKAQGQPDTYLGQLWVDATVSGCPSPNQNTNDDCGVHTNSGVLNHWFYLLTEGGSGTNDIDSTYQLTGLGFSESEQIAFLTETTLSSSADYPTCRTVSINAAATLYGACSKEVEAVTNAWYAVGVGSSYIPCFPTVRFNKTEDNIAETAAPHIGCPASQTMTLGITLTSAASATTDVSLNVSGTAIAGRDYSLSATSVSFAPGEVGPKNITINVYDDAIIDGTRSLNIGYNVNANGGNAVAGNSFNTYVLTITDDDLAPYAGYTDTISYGNYTTNLATSGAFNGTYRDKKIQHLYTAADLKSYGLVAGTINSIAVYGATLASPANTYKNLNFAAGFTSSSSITGSYISGLTTEYSNSAYSVSSGWNYFNLSTPLTWDGSSNLVIQFCYDNTSNGTDDDAIAGEDAGAGSNVTAYQRASSGNNHGCSFTNVTNSQYRPILNIAETIPQTAVETSSISDTADLGPNEDVYFYSANGKIMAHINNLTSFDYGCTQVKTDRTGSSSVQFWNTNTNNYLASKSFRVIPTNNTSSGHYQITLYYTSSEVSGWQTATGQLWNNAQVVKITNGHYIPDVTPATPYSTDVTTLNGTAGTVGTNYTIMGDFNNAGFSGFGSGIPGIPSIVLPVSITSFSGYDKDNYGVLQWSTSSELNNKGFELEKSYDGINFVDVAFINGSGTSITAQKYSYNDKTALTDIQYYRLRQVDVTGHVIHSNVVILKSSRNNPLSIVNVTNPFHNRININFNKTPTGNVRILLMDITGKSIFYIEKPGTASIINVDVDSKLSSGTYILKAETGTDQFVRKLIKQ